jgi:hypothetical protein
MRPHILEEHLAVSTAIKNLMRIAVIALLAIKIDERISAESTDA